MVLAWPAVSRVRTFSLSTILMLVLLSAIGLAAFRKSFGVGLCAGSMLTAGFATVTLANRWRMAQHRPPLSMAESLVAFFWVGFSSLAWSAAGALAVVFPAMCLVGDAHTLSTFPVAEGAAGASVGLALSVFRGAIWWSEQ